jgi:hypothetical protein
VAIGVFDFAPCGAALRMTEGESVVVDKPSRFPPPLSGRMDCAVDSTTI